MRTDHIVTAVLDSGFNTVARVEPDGSHSHDKRLPARRLRPYDASRAADSTDHGLAPDHNVVESIVDHSSDAEGNAHIRVRMRGSDEPVTAVIANLFANCKETITAYCNAQGLSTHALRDGRIANAQGALRRQRVRQGSVKQSHSSWCGESPCAFLRLNGQQ